MTTQSMKHGGGGGRTVPGILEVHTHAEPGETTVRTKVILNVPVTHEGLVGAFAIDGSGSMDKNFEIPRVRSGFWARFNGETTETESKVTKTMRAVVPFLATIDATGTCLLYYWATGRDGKQLQIIGELNAQDGAQREYPAPNVFGSYTFMLPAIVHFIQYLLECKAKGENVQSAVLFIATDGHIHDLDEVIDFSQNGIAPRIKSGELPNTVINVIGVGDQVNMGQLRRLEHESVPEELEDEVEEIFHGEHIDTVDEAEELVAHLVREDVIAFSGGAVVIDPSNGSIIASYEGDVPAVLKLDVPVGCSRLVIRATNGEELAFDIPEDDDED